MSTYQLGNLTRDDLKALMRELMEELLWELEQELPDPDAGLELRPEIAERLRKAMREKRQITAIRLRSTHGEINQP